MTCNGTKQLGYKIHKTPLTFYKQEKKISKIIYFVGNEYCNRRNQYAHEP